MCIFIIVIFNILLIFIFVPIHIHTHTYSFLQALEHLTAFVADADRRTEMAKKRLAETQEELSSDAAEKVCYYLI